MVYTLAFLKALSLTIIIECITAAALGKFLGRRLSLEENYFHLILIVAFASALTLPYAWFILPEFIKSRTVYMIVSEITVTIIEAIFYTFALRVNFKNALILSVACNFASFFIGNIIF